MKNFALIGAAGFIAPKHMKAIKDTGNVLVTAFDPNDSVGVLDSYFPNCAFFTQFDAFDRHVNKLRGTEQQLDYVSICSPNYLHEAHSRFGMKSDCDVICEKPLSINPKNLDYLTQLEQKTGRRVYSVLQLRLHPDVQGLRQEGDLHPHLVTVKYVTPRGPWYDFSWKGDIKKSGGLVLNIGVHILDLLLWLFGPMQEFTVDVNERRRFQCCLQLERANVSLLLSINAGDNSGELAPSRQIAIDGKLLMLDKVFKDLHTDVYQDILGGGGFGIEDVRPAIELGTKLRFSNSPLLSL